MASVTFVSEPWNVSYISAPPSCTVVTVVQHSEIKEMKQLLFSAITTLNDMQVFNREGELLSVFLYRFKRLFRQDKGIQQLTKVNQAVRRYHDYGVLEPMKKLKACFPANIPSDGAKAHLPTQQLLKWVLLRLLANAKIFVRIINLCKDSARYIYGRLYMGWSASYMMFALAINSRILACAKYALIKIIDWYDKLRVFLPILKETVEFVPGFDFPKKMEDFIGYIDLRPPSKRADIDKIFELIDLTRGDESGEDDDVILMDEVIRTIDSDVEIEVVSDNDDNDVTVEKEKIVKKRVRDADVAVLYEKTVKSAPTLAPLKRAHYIEDLGEPVVQIPKESKKRKRKGKNRKRH